MTQPTRRTAAGLALALLTLCTFARADEDDYRVRTGERILSSRTYSPRTAGLGGSYAAVLDGAHGVYLNPAALGELQGNELANAVHSEQVQDGDNETTYTTVTVGGAVHLNELIPDSGIDEGEHHSAGVRFSRYAGDASGERGADFGASLFTVGYGRSFNRGRVLAGASLGYYCTDVNDAAWNDLDIDRYELRGGVLVRLTETLNVGGVIAFGSGGADNDNAGDTGDGELGYSEYRAGASLQLTETWTVTGDLALTRLDLDSDGNAFQTDEYHSIVHASAGSEWVVVPEQAVARAGVFLETDDWELTDATGSYSQRDSRLGLAFGGSYFRDDWAVEYNAQLDTNGDHGHYLSFVLDF